VGVWRDSSVKHVDKKHAVFGVIGYKNGPLRFKLMGYTRSIRPLMIPNNKLISLEEVILEPELAKLSRPELREFCWLRCQRMREPLASVIKLAISNINPKDKQTGICGSRAQIPARIQIHNMPQKENPIPPARYRPIERHSAIFAPASTVQQPGRHQLKAEQNSKATATAQQQSSTQNNHTATTSEGNLRYPVSRIQEVSEKRRGTSTAVGNTTISSDQPRPRTRVRGEADAELQQRIEVERAGRAVQVAPQQDYVITEKVDLVEIQGVTYNRKGTSVLKGMLVGNDKHFAT
jgi:hypothetical protein